ncbi:lectin C-type domain containing protein [Elysia marginata]|uniref:Lectin C-type domain containing protein n=1 Tax=Elysia marginata TaxID=1093978 RepID=A0AAV4GX04_9GAST|nr:lectin C-type domain containing protein [Elysia marginata]
MGWRLLIFIILLDIMGGSCRPNSFREMVSRQINELKAEVNDINSALKNHRRRSCPAAYIRYKRSCFRFVMDEKHKAYWASADQYCLSEGGHLVTVDSKRKYKFIKKYLLKNFKAYFSSGGGALLYTGLIYTDRDAKLPIDLSGPTAEDADAFRWTATGREPERNRSSWNNFPRNNQGPGVFLSCVMLEFDPKSSAGVILWRAHTCSSEKHSFICEVRLPHRP